MNPMKKVILLIFVLLIYSINGVCSTATSIYSITKANENNKIDLSGNFPTTGTRSFSEPIILMQYSEYLDATFTKGLGIITVEIMDDTNNIIYHDNIDTNTQKDYQIFLSDYVNGYYHIVFTNSQGNYLKGDFVIQR